MTESDDLRARLEEEQARRCMLQDQLALATENLQKSMAAELRADSQRDAALARVAELEEALRGMLEALPVVYVKDDKRSILDAAVERAEKAEARLAATVGGLSALVWWQRATKAEAALAEEKDKGYLDALLRVRAERDDLRRQQEATAIQANEWKADADRLRAKLAAATTCLEESRYLHMAACAERNAAMARVAELEAEDDDGLST